VLLRLARSVSLANWAANGVPLLGALEADRAGGRPRKALPCVSVRVMMVLLNVLWMCATPTATFLRTLGLLRAA
jgi:hypothetical protein